MLWTCFWFDMVGPHTTRWLRHSLCPKRRRPSLWWILSQRPAMVEPKGTYWWCGRRLRRLVKCWLHFAAFCRCQLYPLLGPLQFCITKKSVALKKGPRKKKLSKRIVMTHDAKNDQHLQVVIFCWKFGVSNGINFLHSPKLSHLVSLLSWVMSRSPNSSHFFLAALKPPPGRRITAWRRIEENMLKMKPFKNLVL